jgi:S-adenosylmethionine-diacylglycerol 3-amino-3-carboxypropyl transferase
MIDGYRRRPLYSADNEDTRSELIALEITGEDTVVAIAAGGGRALSLLTAGPKRLIAIDRRVDQIFNLELKAAAMDAFDHAGFQAFLGIAQTDDRLDRYAAIRSSLSRSARRYWDHRRGLILAGPFFAGRTETALIRFMRTLKALGLMRWAEPFFQADTLEAQLALLDAHRAHVDRGLFWWRLFCHPLVIYTIAQDPSFLRSTEGSVGAYLVRRILDYASHNLVRDSYLLRLAYDCGLTPSSPLPPYLTPEGFDLARKNLDKLEIQVADLRDFAARFRPSTRVKWSLSDVSCWMTEEAFHGVLRLVVGSGQQGSRYCFRNFAARRGLPKDLRACVLKLRGLGETLDRFDSSLIYRFEVASYPGGAIREQPRLESPSRPGSPDQDGVQHEPAEGGQDPGADECGWCGQVTHCSQHEAHVEPPDENQREHGRNRPREPFETLTRQASANGASQQERRNRQVALGRSQGRARHQLQLHQRIASPERDCDGFASFGPESIARICRIQRESRRSRYWNMTR